MLSYSQAEPGRELTQPRKHLLAEPCTTLMLFSVLFFLRTWTFFLFIEHDAGSEELLAACPPPPMGVEVLQWLPAAAAISYRRRNLRRV